MIVQSACMHVLEKMCVVVHRHFGKKTLFNRYDKASRWRLVFLASRIGDSLLEHE